VAAWSSAPARREGWTRAAVRGTRAAHSRAGSRRAARACAPRGPASTPGRACLGCASCSGVVAPTRRPGLQAGGHMKSFSARIGLSGGTAKKEKLPTISTGGLPKQVLLWFRRAARVAPASPRRPGLRHRLASRARA